MKKIEAVIRPERLMAVSTMLQEMGIMGMNVSELRGHGSEIGEVQVWRGREYKVDLHKKIKLEMVVSDAEVEQAVDMIIREAQTGAIGDGKVFVTHIESAYRIRAGETGHNAITTNGRVVSISPKEPVEDLEIIENTEREAVY